MRKHLYLIDVSRIVVPMFVIIFHAADFMRVYFDYNFLNLDGISKSGGVYYFFALSGFMIYYIYQKDYGNQKLVKKYYYSRFIRIFPIYWFITLCIFPVYFVFPSFGDGNERDLSLILTSIFLLPSENEPILGVAWSLVHTVFFYFMFSIYFIVNPKISMLVFWIWGILSFVFSINIIGNDNFYIHFLFNSNNLIFLFGIFCAYIVSRIKINYPLSLCLVIFGILGFPFSWINTKLEIVHLNIQMITCLSSILLILGLASIDLHKDIKLPKMAQYFGNASLSIYLTHYSIMSVISHLLSSISSFSINNLVLAFSLIIISSIGGCLVYSFVEKPVVKKLKGLNNNYSRDLAKAEEIGGKRIMKKKVAPEK